MKCVVLEILNYWNTGYKDKIYKKHEVSANSKEELFKKVYPYERSARYDSARRYQIEDAALNEEYLEWKKTGVTIEMYYGGGTVD